jgi:hypothetical protein
MSNLEKIKKKREVRVVQGDELSDYFYVSKKHLQVFHNSWIKYGNFQKSIINFQNIFVKFFILD